MSNKPQILIDHEKSIAQRERLDYKTRNVLNLRRISKYKRASFWRGARDLSEFFKPRQFDHATLNDAENSLYENSGFDYYYSNEMHNEIVREHGDDARAIFSYLAPNANPARYADEIELDLVRAYAAAATANYSAQFYNYCRDAIESVANGTGLPWCWLDAKGEPTTEEYDAHAIGFSCSRRAYLDKSADWWPVLWWDKPRTRWDQYSSNAERMDDSETVMDEFISEHLESERCDLEGFDERGGRYADPGDWPYHMTEFSEAVQSFERDDSKMRTQLVAMMRARAPLEARAALVATVNGTPGAKA